MKKTKEANQRSAAMVAGVVLGYAMFVKNVRNVVAIIAETATQKRYRVRRRRSHSINVVIELINAPMPRAIGDFDS